MYGVSETGDRGDSELTVGVGGMTYPLPDQRETPERQEGSNDSCAPAVIACEAMAIMIASAAQQMVGGSSKKVSFLLRTTFDPGKKTA